MGKLIAVVYYADPEWSPHVCRISHTINDSGHRIWTVGIANSVQKGNGTGRFFRKDSFEPFLGMDKGSIHTIYFIIRSFFTLWKQRPDILQPIDVQALVPCTIHAIIRKIPLCYFSLEDVPYLPDLCNRPLRRFIWTFLENWCIKKAKSIAVTADVDAVSYEKRCKISRPYVIRNVPELLPLKQPEQGILRRRFSWERSDKVLIYHGIISKGRGIELAFPLLKKRNDIRLAVAGYGQYIDTLKKTAMEMNVDNRIGWFGPFSYEELPDMLRDADVGIALSQNICRGMLQVLPCKLFEYVHAGLPVVVSNFPEMQKYVAKTSVGLTIDPYNSEDIEKNIFRLLDDASFYKRCKAACLKERLQTNWQNESKIYLDFTSLSRL